MLIFNERTGEFEESANKSVRSKTFEIISKVLGTPYSTIQMNSNLKRDLGADSLDAVEIIMELEDEFNIQIPDEDAASLETVASVVRYLERKI